MVRGQSHTGVGWWERVGSIVGGSEEHKLIGWQYGSVKGRKISVYLLADGSDMQKEGTGWAQTCCLHIFWYCTHDYNPASSLVFSDRAGAVYKLHLCCEIYASSV